MTKHFVFGIAVLLLGMIIGGSLTGVIIGKQIDDLYVQNISLENQLTSAQEELLQLKNNIHSQKRLVSKINTVVNFPVESTLTEYEKGSIKLVLEKKMGEWLKTILGQEIETINYALVPTIIDNRELEVDGVTIRLKVNLVVISEHILVQLDVITLKQQHDKPVTSGAQ